MIAFALLLVVQNAPPLANDDIVVMAQRMRLIEVDMKARKRDGKLALDRCRVTKSSGNAQLDAIPCDVAQACMLGNPVTRKILARCVEEQSQVRLDAIVATGRAGT